MKIDKKRLTVLAVLGLAGVVAVASQGASVWAPFRPAGADRGRVLATVALVFVLGVLVAGAVIFAWHRMLVARRGGAPPLSVLLLRAVPATTVALVLMSLLGIMTVDPGRGAGGGEGVAATRPSSGRSADLLSIVGWFDSPVRAGEGEDESGEADGPGSGPAGFPPLLILAGAVAAAAAVGGVAWWSSRRSRRSDGLEDPSRQEAARRAILSTISEMLTDPDPNTAVIGAYALLLEELAAVGGPRRPYEGPMEHLRRVLTTLRVRPDPLRTLVELFELARFSDRPLTASHRDRALRALQEVADDLAGEPATVEASYG